MEELSIAVGVTSIVLAVVAIAVALWTGKQSAANYTNAATALSEVSEKAAVIERAVTNTQDRLIETVTPTQDDRLKEALLPQVLGNPELLRMFIELGRQQEEGGK